MLLKNIDRWRRQSRERNSNGGWMGAGFENAAREMPDVWQAGPPFPPRAYPAITTPCAPLLELSRRTLLELLPPTEITPLDVRRHRTLS